MFFDAKAKLAEIQNRKGLPANPANSANLRPRLAGLAELAVGETENVETETPAQSRESQQSQPQAVPFGTDTGQPKPSAPAPSRDADTPPLTDTGRVKTWTGKIVSLDDWRNMSEWERHGPKGRIWCGIHREWIDQ
jgi:hypothetical protein